MNAKEISEKWFRLKSNREKLEQDINEVIEAATLAERERCAKIAIQKGIGNGHMETCAWIADKIREGDA